jgi:hypothetical protein
VEHEDPVWTGSVDRVTRGLELAADALAPFLESHSEPALDAARTEV